MDCEILGRLMRMVLGALGWLVDALSFSEMANSRGIREVWRLASSKIMDPDITFWEGTMVIVGLAVRLDRRMVLEAPIPGTGEPAGAPGSAPV